MLSKEELIDGNITNIFCLLKFFNLNKPFYILIYTNINYKKNLCCYIGQQFKI